jgi:phage/plasmid-like protein (TIGR03299 family)
MAHNLEIRNGVASFASTQTAWHGLGQIVGGAMTAQEAIRLAHLDYEVVKVPNFAYHNGEFLDTPASFSTLRTDTNQILGDRIGKNYTIVQNLEAFDFFDTITQAGEAMYETAGVLGIGEKIFVTAKMPDTIRIAGTDDLTEVYVLLTSSHDGSGSIIAAVTPVRVVCQNTLNMALNNTINRVAIRHTSAVKDRLAEAHKVLGISKAFVIEANECFNHLSKKYVSDDSVKELIRNLFNEQERDSTRIKNIEDAVLECYFTGVGQEKIVGTAWGAINGITFYLDHVKNYRNDATKFDNIIGGSSTLVATRATELLLAL